MASRKKGVQILFPLESSEAFADAVEQSEKFLAVVDLYQSWSGPTSVMEPVYRKIKNEHEKLQVKFYTMEESLMAPEQRKYIPATHSGCKPLFLIFKNKVVVSKVLGANAPELELQVVDNANTASADQEE